MTTTTTAGAALDAAALDGLLGAYKSLTKHGEGSVRAAWQFGHQIEVLSGLYSYTDMALAVGVTTGTIGRYRKLYGAYQRPELAVKASRLLETYDIHLLADLADQLGVGPLPHRSLAGRRFRYTCRSCHSHDVAREEFDPDTEAAVVSLWGPLTVATSSRRGR